MCLRTLRTSVALAAALVLGLVSTSVAQSSEVSVGLIKAGPVYSLPNGDFFYKTEGGIGFGADGFVRVGQNSFVGSRFVRTGIGWDREHLKRGVYSPARIVEVVAWSIIVAYRYERTLTAADNGRLRGAIDVGMGLVHRPSGSLQYPPGGPGSNGGFPLEKGNQLTMAVIHMGGEFIFMLSRTMGLSLEASIENGLLTRIIDPIIDIQDDQGSGKPLETGSVLHLGLRGIVDVF
jgi:hypothetical protein